MKIIVCVALLFSLNEIEGANWTHMQNQNSDLLLTEAPVITGQFEQQLDHFNGLKSSIKFKQKYFERKYGDGPLFLFIGGESPLGSWCLWDKGMFATMAAAYSAHAFCLEHRYYGSSIPETLDTKDLGPFNVHQALADIAFFVEMKKDYPEQPVIVFGCSYPGSLAAWSRVQYPALITGAISSSAPLKAEREYKKFDEWISTAVGKECQRDILNATEGIEQLLDSEFEKTIDLLGCTDAITLKGKKFATESILHVIAESIVYPVQYDDSSVPGRNTLTTMCSRFKTARISKKPSNNIDKIDEKKKSASGKAQLSAAVRDALVNALIENVKWVSGLMGLTCDHQNFFLMKEEYSRPVNQKHVFLRAWNYQCCDSFGFWQVASSKDKSTRSKRLQMDYYDESCNAIFKRPDNSAWDSKLVEKSTNAQLGSFDIVKENGASNIHFTNGEIDPWASLSIISIPNGTPASRKLTSHVIPRGSHCTDFSSAKTNEIKIAHEQINNAIASYINKRSYKRRKNKPPKDDL